jgi:microcompartment protein CcmL/EutN
MTLASFVAGGLVALSLALGAVAQAQSSCDAGITKAVGTKVACKTKIIAKAQKEGVAADPAKLAKCETKFASSCAKAQSKGDCSTQTQACDAMQATADACVDSLTEESTTTTSTPPPTTSTTMPSCPVIPPECNGFVTIPKGCPCSLNCSNCVGSVCNTVTGFCQ